MGGEARVSTRGAGERQRGGVQKKNNKQPAAPVMKILPSPISPVCAAAETVRTTRST